MSLLTLPPAVLAAARAAPAAVAPQHAAPVAVVEDEAERIRDLPWSNYDDAEVRAAALAWANGRWQKPGATKSLREIQALALLVAHLFGGAFLPIGTGWGKCTHGNTTVYLPNEGRRATVRELAERGARDFTVTSMSPNGKLAPRQAVAFPSGEKPCVELVLSGGQRITLSTDHPVLTGRGWVHAESVRGDDLVATPRVYPRPEHPLDISDDDVKLYAYFASNGGCTSGHQTFTDDNPALVTEFVHLAEARGWGVHPLNNKGRRATYLRTTGARPFICRWGLDTLSKDKKLPAEFYGLSDRHAALLLNRFVSSDGHLDLHRRAVDIVLASEALVDDLWFLLLRLGISARKSYKRARCQTGEFDAWRLNISGRTNIVAFFERVGLLHGQEERSRALLSAAQAVETNTNVDVVPVGRAEAAEIADELATGRSRVRDDIRARRHPSYVGRDTFRRFCEERKYVGKYAWLANSDILWDRVDSVTPVGTHPVYDLSVPETHNFVANGVVIHNTLIALFMADAMGARRPLLLIPPSMRVPFENARTRDYAPHFRLPTNLRVMAYSQLSQASSTDLLEKLAPDVIVGDEAHNLRDPDAARTKRITRYLRAHPEVRCAWMSGTMTGKKIDDYAHLIEWALGQNSPVPRRKFYPILRAFNNILNAKPTKGSGDSRYVADASPAEWSMFSPLFPDWRDFDEDAPVDAHGDPTGETSPRVTRARELYQERLLHSPGVVGTDALSVGASLYFVRRELRTPQVVLDMIAKLEASWDRPDGERLVLALDVWRCARQLSQGFYYRWRWPHPDNKPDEADKDWLRTRSEWHKQVRLVCQQNLPHLDSPLLVTQAARRALAEAEDVAPAVADNSELLRALRDWTPHSARRWRGKPTPPTETVWVDRFLLDDACRWLEEHPRGLLWYADHAIADELAPRGVPVYGAGTNPEDLAGARGAALSIHVHKDGKNLQKHNENLFMDFLPSGSPMEQAISRTHRSGQEEDEVFVHYYTHTEPAQRAVASARNDAAYIQDTLNTPQRLCYGMWV